MFVNVYLKDLIMKRLFFCHALSLVLAATLLTACSDDDEARMPVPTPVGQLVRKPNCASKA